MRPICRWPWKVEAAIQQIFAKSKAAGVRVGIVNPVTRIVELVQQGFDWISTGEIDAATLQRARSAKPRQ